jgi:hypothetical protein
MFQGTIKETNGKSHEGIIGILFNENMVLLEVRREFLQNITDLTNT